MTDPGRTRVAVAADAVRARTVLAGGVLRPRVLSATADHVRVALVPTSALLLGGDAVRVEVVVGPGARLEVVETAGTVAYPGPPAGWEVQASVGRGALLVWAGLPLVVCDDADVHRSTTLDLADGARALLRETVVLGRAGELGGRFRQTTRVRLDGSALLAEDLDLAPGLRTAPGVLGGNRVLDTVAALGFRPPPGPAGPQAPDPARGHGASARPDSSVRLDLAGPATLQRFLGAAAHLSPLARHADAWLDHVAPAATTVRAPVPA